MDLAKESKPLFKLNLWHLKTNHLFNACFCLINSIDHTLLIADQSDYQDSEQFNTKKAIFGKGLYLPPNYTNGTVKQEIY